MSNLPKFYPRAQFSGNLKWSCIFCGHINIDTIRAGTFRLHCGNCERHFFYGVAIHVPLNSASKMPRDYVIPSWIGEGTEYPYDTIPSRVWDSMPAAWMDLSRRIRERGRVHTIILHESIYLATTDASPSDEP